MLSWMASVGIVVLGVGGGVGCFRAIQRARRRACVHENGQTIIKESRHVSVKFTISGRVRGLKRGVSYRGPGHLRLTDKGLFLGTNQGRILVVVGDLDDRVRTPGPRLMILEGAHPSGRARVRAELVVKNENQWREAIVAILGSKAQG